MSNKDEALLSVSGVTMNFGALTALWQVDLAVARGEIRSIIGPNGAGKTTLFNVITGLMAPVRGKIIFKGEEITGLAPEAINRRGIAKTFQITNIFPALSVFENVWLGCQSRAPRRSSTTLLWKLPDVTDRVLELLKAVGLDDRMDVVAGNLSHGEQRYLELCLALATKPELLLLDEPTAGMTPHETRQATDLIKRLARERGLTVVLIEHDMNVVMDISDQVTVLHQGLKIAEGRPEEVRHEPGVLEAYLGGEL